MTFRAPRPTTRASTTSRSPCATRRPVRTSPPTARGASTSIAGCYRISPLEHLPGTTYNWSYTTPFNLEPGTYSFTVGATDDLGLTTSSTNQGRLTINVQVPGDAFPERDDHARPARSTACRCCTSTWPARPPTTSASRRSGSTVEETRQQPLPAAQRHAVGGVRLLARRRSATPDGDQHDLDAVGRTCRRRATTTSRRSPTTRRTSRTPRPRGATSRYPIYPGDTAADRRPRTCSHPPTGTVFTDGRIFVSGRVEDDQQIAAGAGGDPQRRWAST